MTMCGEGKRRFPPRVGMTRGWEREGSTVWYRVFTPAALGLGGRAAPSRGGEEG